MLQPPPLKKRKKHGQFLMKALLIESWSPKIIINLKNTKNICTSGTNVTPSKPNKEPRPLPSLAPQNLFMKVPKCISLCGWGGIKIFIVQTLMSEQGLTGAKAGDVIGNVHETTSAPAPVTRWAWAKEIAQIMEKRSIYASAVIMRIINNEVLLFQ